MHEALEECSVTEAQRVLERVEALDDGDVYSSEATARLRLISFSVPFAGRRGIAARDARETAPRRINSESQAWLN